MSGAYIDNLLTEMMQELKKKYRHMNEISRLTRELADGLSRDDQITARMVLEMRGRELEEASETDRHIQLFLSSVQGEEAEMLHKLLNGNMKEEEIPAEGQWKDVWELIDKTKSIWRQAMEIDKVTSQRLAGEDSYYKK